MTTIYSLVVDSDSGTECHLFTSNGARDAFAETLCKGAWDEDGDGFPYPSDWRMAWEAMSDIADWWLVVEDHDMPDLQLVEPEVSI